MQLAIETSMQGSATHRTCTATLRSHVNHVHQEMAAESQLSSKRQRDNVNNLNEETLLSHVTHVNHVTYKTLLCDN